jgi:hypothetical protein
MAMNTVSMTETYASACRSYLEDLAYGWQNFQGGISGDEYQKIINLFTYIWEAGELHGFEMRL